MRTPSLDGYQSRSGYLSWLLEYQAVFSHEHPEQGVSVAKTHKRRAVVLLDFRARPPHCAELAYLARGLLPHLLKIGPP